MDASDVLLKMKLKESSLASSNKQGLRLVLHLSHSHLGVTRAKEESMPHCADKTR